MTRQKHIVIVLLLTLLWLRPVVAAPSFQQIGNALVMSNGNVRLEYNLTAGTTDFYWENSKKISSFYSGIGFDTGYVKGINYSSWSYVVTSSNQVVVTATGIGLPAMKQYFTLDHTDSFLVRVDAVGINLKANWMGPVVVDTSGGVDLGVTNDNRALVVPFDNDGFVRYNARSINSSDLGYEVAAFYDNTTRNGLVVGSVTHDVWKTGIFFAGANNKLNLMNVFGGATAPSDVDPHGYVNGNTISSPTMYVGFGDDWRVTMENYTDENKNFAPQLTWTNGVPFGWNSWGVIQQYISYTDAIATSDYFYVNLMNNHFANNGTVYINLDSYWDNMSPAQLQSFTAHCHAHGQKAGIYFGPFVWFGSAADATNWYVEGTTNTYHYSDILLRDKNGNFQSVDGGLAVDPTHPGTKDRIDYYINLFTNWGFDYVKLDFLSHGAFEGVHYDPIVTTGIEAYNQGMQYVLNRINGRMFISESIAPLFPYQYAHSRRIACDAQTSLIGNTEYTMNSVSYGWWLDHLYEFNDPDVMVFGNGANTNEAQSRLVSGAVTGLMLDGDDLSTTSGQQGAQSFLTNAAIDDVARAGRTFTPVEGNTGTSAVNTFVRQDENNWCLAVFNYSSSAANQTIDLARAGLPAGYYVATNLWDGTVVNVTGSINVSLNAKQAKLFRLVARTPLNLRWNTNNSGVWDNAISSNWLNLSNGQASVFNALDQVLFDDTPGVPTTVTLNDMVLPGSMTVDSDGNNFVVGGSGKISGSGNLTKLGSSTLELDTSNDFTGSVAVGGGTLRTGAGALASVVSLEITNSGTLDFHGNALAGNKPVIVSGAGVAGGGALFNSGSDFYNQVLNITLAGNTTFGGSHRWDLANGSSIAGPHNVTLKFPNYAEWDSVSLANDAGDIEIAQGPFGIKGMGNSFGDPNATLTVDSEVDFWNSANGANSGYAKNIHVMPNAAFKMLISPNTSFDANVTLENGANWNYFYGSGGQVMNGSYTLNGIAHLTIADGIVTFTNVISGAGGFVWDAYGPQLVMTASNSYSGPTIIGSGLTLKLTGNGNISHSSLIFFGGNDAASLHVDVGSRPDKTLTLATGQTLAGVGRINGSLVVSPGAALLPGGTNTTLGIITGSNNTGTISATNDVVLEGTTTIKLNGSGINDVVQSTSASITYGGTLNLVNISSNPLAAGESFQIFEANQFSGSFANIIPIAPGAGLVWDTNELNIGKLNVAAAPTPPVVNQIVASDGELVFSGTNGTANGSFVVLTATNAALPLGEWTPISTNTFDANGFFRVTNMITPLLPQQFYRIRLP